MFAFTRMDSRLPGNDEILERGVMGQSPANWDETNQRRRSHESGDPLPI
jgi:hypothetical protein